MSKYPSLFDQIKNISKFSLDLIKYLQQQGPEFMFVSDTVFEQRIDICKKCDRYDPEQIRCQECGCYLEQKAKIILDSCPLNKWSESIEEWDTLVESAMQTMENNS